MRQLIPFLCAVFAFVSCTPKETNVARGDREQILYFGNGTEPQDLDPDIVTGVPEDHIITAIFEGLVNLDPKDSHPVPGVAESWKISADGKTYRFKIRKAANWSNGERLTASDFVYSWRRILEPGLASEYSYMLYYVAGAEEYNSGKLKDFSKVGVKALDEETLEVHLKNPTPFFLSILAHYSTFPVRQATIEKFGKIDTRGTRWTRPGNLISNGPFVLKEWSVNRQIVVEKNPNYWDAERVKLQAIYFFPTESAETEEKLFRAGELHWTNEVPLNKIPVYEKEHPELIHIDPYLGSYFYRLNTTRPPFNNVLVRRAFSMAINRDLIVQKITRGRQIPGYFLTPPGLAGYTARADPVRSRSGSKASGASGLSQWKRVPARGDPF